MNRGITQERLYRITVETVLRSAQKTIEELETKISEWEQRLPDLPANASIKAEMAQEIAETKSRPVPDPPSAPTRIPITAPVDPPDHPIFDPLTDDPGPPDPPAATGDNQPHEPTPE